MITIAKYSRLEDAQRDADRLASRGIRVSIVHGGSGAIIPGTGPGYELQVDPRDMELLKDAEEEVSAELLEDHQYACPSCGSKDYVVRESPLEMALEAFRAVFRKRATFGSVLRFQCKDCDTFFKVDTKD